MFTIFLWSVLLPTTKNDAQKAMTEKSIRRKISKITPIIGLQWGDEDKGKFIDFLVTSLSKKHKLLVARFGGGSNAGHSIFWRDKQIVFHVVPSGILEKDTHNLIGAGVNIDVVSLKKEIEEIKSFVPWWHGNLFVAREDS